MSGSGARNFDLKEEIRAYWSDRAPGFDASPGHRIAEGATAAAWRSLIAAGLGPIEGRRILDLACGTGEISRVLLDAGAEVMGVDFSEGMLDRARAKLAGRRWRGGLADAETLAGLPDAAFDGAITRHLAWTLTDPDAAFTAWFRVLKPGARLLVVDGDWVREGLRGRLLRTLASTLSGAPVEAPDAALHRDILARVPYAEGLTRARLMADLAHAGFVDARAHSLARISLVGLRHGSLGERLRLLAPTRFALSAGRP